MLLIRYVGLKVSALSWDIDRHSVDPNTRPGRLPLGSLRQGTEQGVVDDDDIAPQQPPTCSICEVGHTRQVLRTTDADKKKHDARIVASTLAHGVYV